MFHIDLTLEDTRVIATGDGDGNWHVQSHDGMTGRSNEGDLTSKQFVALVAIMLSPDGDDVDANAGHYADLGEMQATLRSWEACPIP